MPSGLALSHKDISTSIIDVRIPMQRVKSINPTKMTVKAATIAIKIQLVITVRRKTVPDSKDLSTIRETLPIN